MITTRFDPSFDIEKEIPAGSKVGVIACSDCAAVCRTADTKTLDRLCGDIAARGCEIVFRASFDSPCDQRLLKYISKSVPRFFEADLYLLLTCVAGSQSAAGYLAAMRPEGGFSVSTPLLTTGFSTIGARGEHVAACVFCGECVFLDRSVPCPVAGCPVSKKDGPCQTRVDDSCVTDAKRKCSWLY